MFASPDSLSVSNSPSSLASSQIVPPPEAVGIGVAVNVGVGVGVKVGVTSGTGVLVTVLERLGWAGEAVEAPLETDDCEADHDHHHHDHTLVFDSWTYTTDKPFNYRAIRKAIRNLPATIYRAKGKLVVAESDRQALFHLVGRRASLILTQPWGEQKPRSQIVVIGSEGGVDADLLAAHFEACLAENQTPSESKAAVQSAWSGITRVYDARDIAT